jgi:hypothetical protein
MDAIVLEQTPECLLKRPNKVGRIAQVRILRGSLLQRGPLERTLLEPSGSAKAHQRSWAAPGCLEGWE